MILLSIILMFAKEFLLIGVIVSFGFVAYALASVKPEKVKHVMTNKGIRTGGNIYVWQVMGRFWWDEKFKQEFLNIEVAGQLPGMIQLLLGNGDKKKIEEITSKYLVKEKPTPTWFDNASKWLQDKVPLEAEE